MTQAPPLVLASASPRRAELLAMLGLAFRVVASDVPEDLLSGETPEAHVERLSRTKAARVREGEPDSLILAGDTVVVLDGRVLGKPSDEEEAVEMLLRLSGRTHTVMSGIAVSSPTGETRSAMVRTEVTFRSFGEEAARAYVATGEPLDKAGAYGIQGFGAALVRKVEGDYYTVVGLPIPAFIVLLRELGWRYRFGELVPASASLES